MAFSNLPPGVTNAMIEAQCGEGPCAVCGRAVDSCVCPECTVCGATGDIKCYEFVADSILGPYHGQKLTREQILAREQVRIHILQSRLNTLKVEYDILNNTTDWDPSDWILDDLWR